MKILSNEGYLDAVAMFFELNDKQFERTQTDKNFIFDLDFLTECNYAKGDNALFYCVYNNGDDHDLIQRHLEKLLKEYKTISWWDRNREKFKTIKGGKDVQVS